MLMGSLEETQHATHLPYLHNNRLRNACLSREVPLSMFLGKHPGGHN